jgi:glutathione S-transferase
MAKPTLVIGNKCYSSWSLRPWLLLRHAEIPFEELRIPLYTAETRARILPHSPSGRVPVFIDGALRIWESLAICEHLAERHPERCGWPRGAEARGVARSVSAEMHAGFQALRSELPLYCRGARRGVVPGPAARADLERVFSLLADCRSRFGAGGPWLFGSFSPADAMFAPVALRLLTYGVATPPAVGAWVDSIRRHPAIEDWIAAARRETEVVAEAERGEPA